MNIHFFCYPKPWLQTPGFDSIQRSAIKSWLCLSPQSITFLGSDHGTAEAATEFDVKHIPDVKLNEWGTPLVSSIFERIRAATKPDDIVCYINADILLDETFPKTLEALLKESLTSASAEGWLAVGKRTDVDLAINEDHQPEPITVEDAQQLAAERGVDHGWAGIDYFIFPSQTYKFVYPFALGKFVWDQWLVGNAYRRGLWTVDCSETLLVIHLNSPWYLNGKPTRDRRAIHDSTEGIRNRGFDYYQKTILSGTHYATKMTKDGIEIVKKTLIHD